MENEVRRLASLIEQHEKQIDSLNTDHSRRMHDEKTRLETK